MVGRWEGYIADGRFKLSVDSRVGVDGIPAGLEGVERERVEREVKMASCTSFHSFLIDFREGVNDDDG